MNRKEWQGLDQARNLFAGGADQARLFEARQKQQETGRNLARFAQRGTQANNGPAE